MILSDALETMHSLANMGVLDDADPGMADEVDRQRDAVDTVGDFVGNHWEDLDARWGDAMLSSDRAVSFPDADLDAVRAIAAETGHPLAQAMAIALELATQQVPDLDEDSEAHQAVSMSIEFWEQAGREICANTASIDTGPAA